MRRVIALILLSVPTAVAYCATVTLIPQPDYPYLGISCGGVLLSTFVTGFDVNDNIRGEVHASTQCGGSGRGGGYQVTQYDSWHSILWDIEGGVIETLPYDGVVPDPAFRATDANGNMIHDVPVPDTKQYTGVLETPTAGPAMSTSGPSASSNSVQTPTPATTATGSSGGRGMLNWATLFALLAAGVVRRARH